MKNLIRKILREDTDDQSYINYILDKINKKGLTSLSSAERNRLDKLSQGEIEDRTLRTIDGDMYIGDVSLDRYNSPEYKKHIYPVSDVISDANRMFFSQLDKMDISGIEINGEYLPIEVIEEMSGQHLKIGEVYISPFWEGYKGIVVNDNISGDSYTMDLNTIPESIEEMVEFIERLFNDYIYDIV